MDRSARQWEQLSVLPQCGPWSSVLPCRPQRPAWVGGCCAPALRVILCPIGSCTTQSRGFSSGRACVCPLGELAPREVLWWWKGIHLTTFPCFKGLYRNRHTRGPNHTVLQ